MSNLFNLILSFSESNKAHKANESNVRHGLYGTPRIILTVGNVDSPDKCAIRARAERAPIFIKPIKYGLRASEASALFNLFLFLKIAKFNKTRAHQKSSIKLAKPMRLFRFLRCDKKKFSACV